jgi:uncharacterized membrane protein (DUF106 family)
MLMEWIQASPKLSIIVFGLGVSFFISLVNYFVLDKEKMHSIKARQKELQKEMREHQKAGNHTKAMDLNKELLPLMSEMFKHSFKPMLITFLPIILLFGFLRGAYAETALASSWLWWYIGISIIGSLAFRKLFRLP